MIYLIDENMAIPDSVINKFDNVVNTRTLFPKGTADYSIISYAIKNDMVLVTKDTAMSIKALVNGVTVLLVNDYWDIITMIKPSIIDTGEYKDLYDYLVERFRSETK